MIEAEWDGNSLEGAQSSMSEDGRICNNMF